MKIAFVGYGDLGKQVHSMILQSENPTTVRYFDDILEKGNHPHAVPFKDYVHEEYHEFVFYICLGYRHLVEKQKIIDFLLSQDRVVGSCIHSSSYINPSAKLGKGIVIYPLCNIDQNVSLGSGVILHNSVTISHDSVIGGCSYISPGVTLSGFVRLGNCAFVGAGAVIADKVSIGDYVQVGIGTVVTQDVPPNASVIGNPMKKLEKRLAYK